MTQLTDAVAEAIDALTRWAAEIVQIAVNALVPYARNARTHSPEQIALIAESIRKFGLNAPALMGPNVTIIAGHGRVLAAKRLGMTTIPAISLGHLSEAEIRAYIIADNKLAGRTKQLSTTPPQPAPVGQRLASDQRAAEITWRLVGFRMATDLCWPQRLAVKPDSPVPESCSRNRPRWSRGERGMEIPRATTSSLSTSMMQPPSRRSSRQPSATSVWETAVA